MKLRGLLLGTAVALGSASAADAAMTTPTGWYLSLAGGANWLEDSDYTATGGSTYAGHDDYDTGYIVAGAVGYDWGRWRAEFEVAYRENDIDCVTNATGAGACLVGTAALGGEVWELSQMVNVLYDISFGGRFSGSVGAGLGGVLVVAEPQLVNWGVFRPDLDDYVFAGQLIAQVAYALTDRWQLYADYHFLIAEDPENNWAAVPNVVQWEKSDHSVMIGFRFDLQRDGAPPPPKAEEPPPAPKAPKQFIVFFGFNKSNLTPEAERVVSDAAAAAKEYGSASIIVIGHTDTVGSPQYNIRLSMRRAQAVKDGLMRNEIPASAISTSGRGETELMVQTGDGVKEPQNRRATIDLE